MVLVDTSVWIRALSGRAPYRAELDRLLSRDEVVGHQLVYGELLIGAQGGRPQVLAAYALMHQANLIPHSDVVSFVRAKKLHGRGVGWVDIHLLAAAIAGRCKLWTADPRLDTLAREFGVAYDAA